MRSNQFIVCVAVGLAAIAPAVADDSRYALAVSGGISLGAYDSGRNWVALEYLRHLRAQRGEDAESPLASVAGASAGAINAFVSALYWCSGTGEWSGSKISVENNPFRDLWTGMTFERLLPRDADEDWEVDQSKYLNERDGPFQPDGALARAYATRDFVERLRESYRGDDFRKDCELPLGFAVTRVEPLMERVFADVDYELPAQTLYLTLKFDIQDGKPQMRVLDMSRDVRTVRFDDRTYRFDGRPLDLNLGGEEIPFDRVIEVLFASSAFPVAFGRMYLDHCWNDVHGVRKCGEAAFVDGGILDNMPIGLALALAGDGDRLRFFYIDPNIRRDVESIPDPAGTPTYGLADQLAFLGGTLSAVENASRAETLFSLCQPIAGFNVEPENCYGRAVVITRGEPITGTLVGHFGAFYDERFAAYDFAVGVFDGLHALARDGFAPNALSAGTSLGIADDSTTWQLVRILAGEAVPHPRSNELDEFLAIRTALSSSLMDEDELPTVEAQFKPFAKSLFTQSKAFKVTDPTLGDALLFPDEWYSGIARLATSRLRYLEDRRRHELKASGTGYEEPVDAKVLRKTVTWADIHLRQTAPRTGFEWFPTANDRFAWIPYQVFGEVSDGALQFNQMPTLRVSRNWRVEFPIGVVWDPDSVETNLQGVAGATVILPFGTDSTWRLGLAMRGYRDFDRGGRSRKHYGGAGLVLDTPVKLRMELVRRASPSGNDWMLMFGFNDVPALLPKHSADDF